LKSVRAKDDKCGEILKQEGVIDNVTIPLISVESWQSVFEDLQRAYENVITEIESLNDNESDFVIGRIVKSGKQFVCIRHFDADGVWDSEPRKLAYADITSVTFSSRYIRMFSKYLDEPPQSAEPMSMNVWMNQSWEKRLDIKGTRAGLRVVFDSGVDAEVRRACKEFCHWLRGEFPFPVRVPVYVKVHQKLRVLDGDTAYGTFLGPDDRHVEPYIRIATGDYADMVTKYGQDNALVGILQTIAHELTHYFQWLSDLRLTQKGEERQAISYANKIMDAYAETRERP
jgi:hypothetical protein